MKEGSMGFNTTVIVMNDAVDQIANDPTFGKKLAQAIMGMFGDRRPIDVSAGNHLNAATVIESHHADNTALVAVGGNFATALLQTCGYRHHEVQGQEQLLRELADKLGYRISKKPAGPGRVFPRGWTLG
jgi:hypothetical protein